MHKVLIFFAFLFVNAYAQESCRVPTTLTNFDLESYANGDWFRIEMAPSSGPPRYKCFSLSYTTLDSQRMEAKTTYKNISSNLWEEERGTVFIPDLKKPGVWQTSWTGVNVNHVILATNYKHWALYYGCEMVNNVRVETCSILSRTPIFDPIQLDMLKAIAVGLGFPESTHIPIDQSGCD